jgi:hypothetical protein
VGPKSFQPGRGNWITAKGDYSGECLGLMGGGQARVSRRLGILKGFIIALHPCHKVSTFERASIAVVWALVFAK